MAVSYRLLKSTRAPWLLLSAFIYFSQKWEQDNRDGCNVEFLEDLNLSKLQIEILFLPHEEQTLY
jgi:hypothetical protein